MIFSKMSFPLSLLSLRVPLFEEISGNLVVTFRGKITKEYLENLDLNKRQITAMEYIKKIGKITNKNYREMFPEISNETARLDLSTMVRKKLLNKRGEYPKFIPDLSQIIINII